VRLGINITRRVRMKSYRLALAAMLWLAAAGTALAQAESGKEFKPVEGQAGKDVVWVPTPADMVERMLDLAQLTPQDFVIDLGSGDGRNVIAAARRGARALGVEYNPEMVTLSRRNAVQAGVADRAQFMQGDMFEADISQATVLALFLLPDNLRKLTPKFMALKPGTRIVANTFGIDGWQHDDIYKMGDNCYSWCSALLYVVPARVAGTWQMEGGKDSLVLEQDFQSVKGELLSGRAKAVIGNGRLRGDWISFTLGKAQYEGRVLGDAIEGIVQGGGKWSARRK
jgi:SAM-dependent methyltransferase